MTHPPLSMVIPTDYRLSTLSLLIEINEGFQLHPLKGDQYTFTAPPTWQQSNLVFSIQPQPCITQTEYLRQKQIANCRWNEGMNGWHCGSSIGLYFRIGQWQ